VGVFFFFFFSLYVGYQLVIGGQKTPLYASTEGKLFPNNKVIESLVVFFFLKKKIYYYFLTYPHKVNERKYSN
jgi:hypothetical protein